MHRKRVDIVKVEMVKEGCTYYAERKVKNPCDALPLVRSYIGASDREEFGIICLNTKNEPTNISTISIGTLNSSLVHPREVFKIAILSNSNSIILFHNHPSGDNQPSDEDNKVTQRLKDAGELLGISVLDHVIIGDYYYSYKEEMNIL